MFNGILGEFVKYPNGLIDMNRLSESIRFDAKCTSIIAVQKRSNLQTAHLSTNVDRDLQCLQDLSYGDKIQDKFWLFTTDTHLKIEIVNTLKEEYEYWQWLVKPLYSSLNTACVNYFLTQTILWEIIDMLFPVPTQVFIDSEIFKQEKYQHFCVGDQEGGIISCCKCRWQNYNPIWHISQCNLQTLNLHLNSTLHLS